MRRVYFVCACLLALLFNGCKKDQSIISNTTKQSTISGKLSDWVSGDTLTNGTYVFKNNNGQCFQVGSTNTGEVVQQNTYIGLANQQWDVVNLNNGYYKIANHQSHLVLDVPGLSTAQNVQLVQWTSNGGDNQMWKILNQGKYYALINKHSGLVVTLNNNTTTQFEKITQTTFVANAAHAWIPTQVNLQRISISGKKFVDQTGAEFKLWGFNYITNSKEKLIEDKWDQPAVMTTIGNDFAYMGGTLGANVVRLCLQYNKFMTSPTTPNIPNIMRLLQVVNFAKQNDIHLIITGLNAFRPADQPSWYTNLSDADRWKAQANFWTAISTALANNPTIFSYDLMNEPVVNSGNSAITGSNWSADGSSLDSADWFGQYLTRQPYPGSTNGVSNWESQMHNWIKQMTAAIRAKDATTPITAGMLNLPPFADMTTDLDYASLHLYITNNQQGNTSIAQYTSAKPLVIEETWPFWLSGLDANTLKTYVLANKTVVSGWVSHYFGKTIDQYQNEKSQPLDDFNTMTWFKNFQSIAPVMKTP